MARQSVEVDYKSFKATEATTWHLSPYLLKEYNNRWFVMGYNTGMEMIQNLALDRIVAIRPDNTGTYVENTFFEPEQFLGEMIGVSRNLDSVPQRVTLRVEAQNAPYVFTKPIHSSQQLLSTNADGSVVIALDVIINYELRSHLLSMIPWVEVLAPESLRLSIAGLLNTAAARYNYSR